MNSTHAERTRLLAALRPTTSGGIIEFLQPLSPDGASPTAFALAVWPFPLEVGPEAALSALGYLRQPAVEDADEHTYTHTSGQSQLFISGAGTSAFHHHVLLRDYLHHDAAARATWPGWPENMSERKAAMAALLPAAEAWWIDHHGFGPVQAVANELAGLTAQWMIAGGWSLDLHVGRVGRVHHDVDVVVARAGQMALQAHLLDRSWSLLTPLEGRLEPWPPHTLLELPRHQVHAHRGDDFIDFLLTDLSGGVWRFRRQPEVIRDLERAARRTEAGLPYLAPELALLFKSRNTSRPPRPRPQDQADFDRTFPHLDPEQRAWLRWALVATQPDHPWIGLVA